MPKLPIDISDIIGAVQKGTKQGKKKVQVALYVGTTCGDMFCETLKALFLPQGDSVELHVEPYAKTPPAPNKKADVVLVAAGVEAGAALYAMSLQAADYCCMLMTDNLVGLADACESEGFDLGLDGVVFFDTLASSTVPSFMRDCADWIIEHMDRQRFALACSFPFLVDPLANELVRTTSLQNAVVGAVPFIKGADFPVMTVNQIKLIIELATLHGFAVELARIPEIAVVVASAFCMRALARALVGKVPGIGFAIRGAIGYAGTYCLGAFAADYFAHGGSVEGLTSAMRSAKENIYSNANSLKDNVLTLAQQRISVVPRQ